MFHKKSFWEENTINYPKIIYPLHFSSAEINDASAYDHLYYRCPGDLS
jgi:hypothetical protein